MELLFDLKISKDENGRKKWKNTFLFKWAEFYNPIENILWSSLHTHVFSSSFSHEKIGEMKRLELWMDCFATFMESVRIIIHLNTKSKEENYGHELHLQL